MVGNFPLTDLHEPLVIVVINIVANLLWWFLVVFVAALPVQVKLKLNQEKQVKGVKAKKVVAKEEAQEQVAKEEAAQEQVAKEEE